MKFEKLMNETQEMCMIALRQEFADLVNQLVNKLSTNNGDRSKIVANSMFNKLNEFFSEIQTKNIFQDEELINLTEEAKQIINNISPYSLKYNKDTREQIHTEMQNLQNTLKQSIIDLPRRQIRLEQEEAQ